MYSKHNENNVVKLMILSSSNIYIIALEAVYKILALQNLKTIQWE